MAEEIFVKELVDRFMEDYGNYASQVVYNPIKLSLIKASLKKLIDRCNLYDSVMRDAKQAQVIVGTVERLELQKDLIYEAFFEVQNLINDYIGQKIVMTYVHVDENTGQREVRIFDNTVANVSVGTFERWSGGATYSKLSYEMVQHYQKLRNSLPEELNRGLQETAQQVDNRFKKYKRRILWKDPNNEWIGYRLTTRGPINEAYVNFYIHEIQLNNSLNNNIHIFMLDSKYGAINADNANGFLIGDVSLGGLQFAVKGKGGGVQNFSNVIAGLQALYQNFSHQSVLDFKQKFIDQELKTAKSQLIKMEEKDMQGLIRYHKDKLLKNLPYINKS